MMKKRIYSAMVLLILATAVFADTFELRFEKE
jgi:hypothetical protein